jgi:catechol 2,3-dioxygenase-like lactoylglutathione lyase family enzyme
MQSLRTVPTAPAVLVTRCRHLRKAQTMNSTDTTGTDKRYFLGRRMQLAFLVKDMDAALELWTDKLGVGPFVVFEQSLGQRHFVHRGERSPVEIALALSYVGDTQIELICQKNDAPSIYTEAFQKGCVSGTAHHMAFWPDDMDAAWRELKAQGFEEVASIQSPSGEVDVYYFSSPPALGLMLEIVPMSSARRVYFSQIKALCERSAGSQKALRFRDKDHFLSTIASQSK